MDQILDANVQITELVHRNLPRDLSKTGAWGISAEQVLRTAIIHFNKSPNFTSPK